MAFDTASNLINDAAKELGLLTTAVANPFASSDANVLQLCALAKSVGQELLRVHPWQQLQATGTITTASGTASYALATDFQRIVDQTGWNRTDIAPLGGPLNARQWQAIQASSTSVVDTAFRIYSDRVYLTPTPSSIETIAYEYISRYWVDRNWVASTAYVVGDYVINSGNLYLCDTSGTSASSGGPTLTTANQTDGTARWDYVSAAIIGTMEAPTAGTDSIRFDRHLFTRALKLSFLRAKGFDSSAAAIDYERAYAMATGADGAAPVLSMGGRRGIKLLDGANFPETGYGS